MRKRQPSNTSNEYLEKAKKILGQCCKDAKKTVEKMTKFRQSNIHQLRLNYSSNAFKNYYENMMLSRANYQKLESSYQTVMAFIDGLLQQVSQEKSSLTKNIQACLEEITRCSNLTEQEQYITKYSNIYYKEENGSKTECVKYLGQIHQSLITQTNKLREVQTILSRVQKKQNSKSKTGINSDQVEISKDFSQRQNKKFPDLDLLKKVVTEIAFEKKQASKTSPCMFIQDSENSSLQITCLEMLKQTTDFMNSVYKFSQLLSFDDSSIRDDRRFLKCMNENDLLNCTVDQIENRFNLIKVEFHKINQLLNRIKKLSVFNQEIRVKFKSSEDIKSSLSPISVYKNTENTWNRIHRVKSQLQFPIRNRSTFIQQQTVKLMEKIENIEQDHSENSKSNNQKITQLKQQLDKQTNQKNSLQKIIRTTKYQHHNQLSALNFKVKELNTSLVQKQKELNQTKQQLSQLNEIFTKVSSVLGKKLNNKELKINELAEEIQNYNPPIGMKLITSLIIHGNDRQRFSIIATIEKFSKKTIRRTDLLCRFPDVKSILHHLKYANNFEFIVIYKTVKGTIFGSYSEGLKKQTFIFSFTQSGQNKASDVQFYIPENLPVEIPSLELSQGRYLQYGAGQLRLNCLELETITAKSDVKGGSYYGLDWREVMNENNEEKVPLCEVELHKVQFEEK